MAVQNNASNPTIANLNYTNLAFPGPAAYPFYSASQSNLCNVYVPNDSTLSRCEQSQSFGCLKPGSALHVT